MVKIKGQKERTRHYLKPNHGNHVPRNIVVVQVHPAEKPDKQQENALLQKLDFGVAHFIRVVDGERERWDRITFTEPEQFWNWLAKKYRKNTAIWLIGHGIAKSFTLLEGWSLVDKGLLRLTPKSPTQLQLKADERFDVQLTEGWLVDGDPPTIVLLYAGSCCLHLVDVQNYGKASIDEIADTVKIKLEQKPAIEDDFSHWEYWLSRQVEAVRIYTAELMKWWHKNDLGTFRHTIGSLAMAAFRHRFMQPRSILVHDCEPVLEMERKALAGGEFRCFWVGNVVEFGLGSQKETSRKRKTVQQRYGPVHVYDANALYPSVMATELFPVELCAWIEKGSLADLLAWRERLLLLAEVEVETNEETYPAEHDGERYWCRGRYWTCLCGPELLQAMEMNHVRAVGRVVGYWPGRPFERFVKWFHDQRRWAQVEGKTLQARYLKICMNALAGKWGQRQHQWEFIRYPMPPMNWGKWMSINAQEGTVSEYRAIAGSVQLRQLGVESLESCPAIEAFINSHARVRMQKLIASLPAGSVLYQSSDGLHVTQEAVPAMQAHLESYGGELQKFRLEATHQTAAYRGPNDYTISGVNVIAGVLSNTPIGDDGKYEQIEEPTLRTILSREPGGVMRVRKIVHQLGGLHPRGCLAKDGSVSPPYLLGGQLHLKTSDMAVRQFLKERSGTPACPIEPRIDS